MKNSIKPKVELDSSSGECTVQINYRTLRSILTEAALQLYDHPIETAPEVGEYASVIARNNRISREWYDDMLKTIKDLDDSLDDQLRKSHS